MRESNFYQDIYSFLKLYKKKRVHKFIIPVVLGVIYKLISIGLFIIPIQAIKSVSEKKFSSIISNIFEFFRLIKPPDEYVYMFFLILIIASLLMLIFINKLKKSYLLKIKKEFNYLDKKSQNNDTKYEISKKKGINKNIDNFIQNSENIFFCLALYAFIFFYDYQISLILILGSFIYILITNISNIDSDKSDRKKTQPNYSFQKIFLIFFRKLNIDSKIIKPLTSTIIMVLIMTLLYLRTNSSISIIFIFLIRVFQNNMLNSLKKFIKNDKLPF